MGQKYVTIKDKLKGQNGRPSKHDARYKNSGRPSVMTPEVLAKLDHAFSIDCSVIEACSYADISQDAFYDYQSKNPQFAERNRMLRQKPILKARNTIVAALNQPQHAQWYIARKRKKEFSERIENTTDITIKEEASPEVKKLADLLNGLHRKTK